MTAFKELNLVQGTAEWLEARRQHITATEIAHVRAGFTSIYKLVCQKRGIIPPEDLSQKAPIIEGKHFEPLVRQQIAKMLPVLLNDGQNDLPQPCIESLEDPFFMASLDGYSAKKNIVVEIKNIFSRAHANYEDVSANGLNAAIPRKYGYYYQIQWQLFVSGAAFALLAFHWSPDGTTFHPENVRIVQVKRDNAAIAELKALALKIKDILLNNLEVKPDISDAVYLSSDQLNAVSPLIEQYRFIDTAYQQTMEAINTLKAKRSELIEKLEASLLDGNVSKVIGAGFALSRCERKGGYDVEQMIKDGLISAESAEKYRKTSSFSTKITLS